MMLNSFFVAVEVVSAELVICDLNNPQIRHSIDHKDSWEWFCGILRFTLNRTKGE